MKGLAWYCIVFSAYMELYMLSELLDTYEASFFTLLAMALFAPLIVFAVGFLKLKK
jgi:hypothetical protein